jgi:nucleoside-diphosphate-sugar epimerase
LPNPVNDYAVSKLAMEMMARLWLDRLPITIVRPFNYTGPGQSLDFVLPKIVAHFACRQRSIMLGNLDVERDFSDVNSIADAYCRLLDSAPRGEVFNLCSGRAVSLRTVLELMGKIAGYHIDVGTDPALQRRHEVRRLRGSDQKLRACIGERHLPSLQDTLYAMYQAMLPGTKRGDAE